MSKVIAVVFTWNNYTEENISSLKEFGEECRWMIFGKETAPSTGTPHLQGYMHFNNARSLSALKKRFNGCWMEKAKGKADDSKTYCSKECNDVFEIGEMPSQGKRVDLELVCKELREGRKTCDDILIESPGLWAQYNKLFEASEDMYMRNCFRTEMTSCKWYHGKTGVGKSHLALNGYDPRKTYKWSNNDRGWWDNYRQQEIVVLNDFRGELKYNELLQLVDKWPHEVPRRGKAPRPFTSKMIIITSSLTPEEVYCNRMQEDSIAQLLRRIEVVEILAGGKEVVRGNILPGPIIEMPSGLRPSEAVLPTQIRYILDNKDRIGYND